MPRAQARERARVSSVQHRVWVALHYLGGGDGSFAMQGPTSSCSARCRASPCFLPSRAVSKVRVGRIQRPAIRKTIFMEVLPVLQDQSALTSATFTILAVFSFSSGRSLLKGW